METIPPDVSGSSVARDRSAFIIVRSLRQGYAIPIDHVREVTRLPKVSGIPNSPAEMRGVINFRGEVVPVVDLRVLLGHVSRKQEIADLVQLLRDREQDHHNWIKELEASVREKRPFKLARDPHMCKFGRWYDTYKPDHAALAFIWSSLDHPHKAIHALADKVLARTERGETAEALALIEHARGSDLRALVDLLGEATHGLEQDTRELVVVMGIAGKQVALCVDSAEAVEDQEGIEFHPLPDALPPAARRLVTDVMRRPGHEEMVLCLDPGRLVARGPRNGPEVALAA